MKKNKSIEYTTEWFTIEKFLHENQDYYSMNMANGATILAITPEKEIVLVYQYRPVLETYTLELPAGTIEDNESPESNIRKELYEETGYRCLDIKLLDVSPLVASRLTSKCYLFYGIEAVKDEAFVTQEDIQVVLVPLNKIQEYILTGKFDHLAGLASLLIAQWKFGLDYTCIPSEEIYTDV